MSQAVDHSHAAEPTFHQQGAEGPLEVVRVDDADPLFSHDASKATHELGIEQDEFAPVRAGGKFVVGSEVAGTMQRESGNIGGRAQMVGCHVYVVARAVERLADLKDALRRSPSGGEGARRDHRHG
jgi:hypothetical protein